MAQPLQGAMWKQLLQRSARETLTLQGRIREMLVSAILDGQLKPGAPVPSSRELANELGVGRITVVLAYQQLADEGYVESRERKGHFVSSALLGQRAQTRTVHDGLSQQPPIDWNKRLCQHPSLQRSIVKPFSWQKSRYPFLTDFWAKRLVRAYGTEAAEVLGDARAAGDLGQDFGDLPVGHHVSQTV